MKYGKACKLRSNNIGFFSLFLIGFIVPVLYYYTMQKMTTKLEKKPIQPFNIFREDLLYIIKHN